jgi:hypothetical protein
MDFQSYIVVSFCVQRLKVGGDCFVDIGGIDDYYCLNILFIKDVYFQFVGLVFNGKL